VLENVWNFGFRIAEPKLPFVENAEKLSKKIFLCNNFQKKNKIFKKKRFKIIAQEFLKSFRKKIFLRRLRTLGRDFQALIKIILIY
jgi:hypothetical protein